MRDLYWGKKPGRHQPARPRKTVKVSYTEKM